MVNTLTLTTAGAAVNASSVAVTNPVFTAQPRAAPGTLVVKIIGYTAVAIRIAGKIAFTTVAINTHYSFVANTGAVRLTFTSTVAGIIGSAQTFCLAIIAHIAGFTYGAVAGGIPVAETGCAAAFYIIMVETDCAATFGRKMVITGANAFTLKAVITSAVTAANSSAFGYARATAGTFLAEIAFFTDATIFTTPVAIAFTGAVTFYTVVTNTVTATNLGIKTGTLSLAFFAVTPGIATHLADGFAAGILLAKPALLQNAGGAATVAGVIAAVIAVFEALFAPVTANHGRTGKTNTVFAMLGINVTFAVAFAYFMAGAQITDKAGFTFIITFAGSAFRHSAVNGVFMLNTTG